VPRAFGGENGPTVTICVDCHTLAHRLGEKFYSGKWSKPAFTDPNMQSRLEYLGIVIANAQHAVEGDANKRVSYCGVFDGEAHSKLKRLCEYYGRSQHKIILYAINELYNRTFVSTRSLLRGNYRDKKGNTE
jgi:hypothetical protein